MTRKGYMEIGIMALNIICHEGNKKNRKSATGVNLTQATRNWLYRRNLWNYHNTAREAVTLFGVDVMHDNHIPNVDAISQIKLKALRVKYAD